MFDARNAGAAESQTVDEMEMELAAIEVAINRMRHRQAELIGRLDRAQVTLSNGARTLAEWVAGRLDVSTRTARDLVSLARSPEKDEASWESFDRTVVTRRLIDAGADDARVAESRGFDIGVVARMAGRHRRLTAEAERDAMAWRYLSMQASLDESHWLLSGRLVGTDGAAVSEILDRTADSFPALPDGSREPRNARRADALVLHVTGSGSSDETDGPRVSTNVTVFVDARDAAPTNGERGAWIVDGPRVGPATLERILCESTIEVTALTSDGTPLAIGDATTTIPPRTRRHVLHPDPGVCAADGCTSGFQLQPHHIRPRAEGGDNHADNAPFRDEFAQQTPSGRRRRQAVPSSPSCPRPGVPHRSGLATGTHPVPCPEGRDPP